MLCTIESMILQGVEGKRKRIRGGACVSGLGSLSNREDRDKVCRLVHPQGRIYPIEDFFVCEHFRHHAEHVGPQGQEGRKGLPNQVVCQHFLGPDKEKPRKPLLVQDDATVILFQKGLQVPVSLPGI